MESKIQPGPVCQGWACDSGSDRSALHVVGQARWYRTGGDLSVPLQDGTLRGCLTMDWGFLGSLWVSLAVTGAVRVGITSRLFIVRRCGKEPVALAAPGMVRGSTPGPTLTSNEAAFAQLQSRPEWDRDNSCPFCHRLCLRGVVRETIPSGGGLGLVLPPGDSLRLCYLPT